MRSSDRGYVTAEAAVALPVLALFAMILIWGQMAASAHIRCVDAARAGARAAARSEPREAALAAARAAAPRGAEIGLRRGDGLVRVTVAVRAPGPGPLGLRLRSEAVASDESVAGPPEETETGRSGTGPPAPDGGAAEPVDPAGPPEKSGGGR
ncbi:pilus assembly protein [Streptomyces sp. S07_1.15]|uniref:TadE family type IV pilus minor pilin n=1 Tax=Streptomyces sp. S07_1.15 TaxID=2873925 RepID=UPI001D15BA36|nr:TadE family type IV pilus minor pilin [Streptomyces sp. S07_1.15]MCC3652603.1 pilus assembly protein [Streptomyces sp. S07_1.15]